MGKVQNDRANYVSRSKLVARKAQPGKKGQRPDDRRNFLTALIDVNFYVDFARSAVKRRAK